MTNPAPLTEVLPEIKALPPQYSEDALAAKFTDAHLTNLRYTHELGKYHRLTRTPEGGLFWERDTVLSTFDKIRDFIREEAMLREEESKQRQLCKASTISAVEQLVRCDQRTAMTVDQWDSHDMLLNTTAGIVDLETGKLLPADPLKFFTKITACGPSFERPELWLSCLNTWTAGDEELQEFLKRVLGYCLTGNTSEQQFMFVSGPGRNGKGVMLNTVSGIMGSDATEYSRIAPPDVFTVPKSGEKHPTALARLVGCRMALATETESNSKWAERQLKALTGGDRIAARYMRQDFFEFVPKFKLVISGNHRPTLSTVDEAIRSRINIVPFDVIIPREERDPQLSSKLRAEWPQILGWMIQGCLEWQRDGLNPPESVRLATDEYLESQDLMGQWIGECCLLGPNKRGKSPDLYKSWIEWCELNNQYKTSQRAFLGSLKERPKIRAIHTASGNFIEGIGLLAEGGYTV